MKLRSFRIGILCSVALVLLPFSRSAAAQSYCPGCEAGVIGAAIGVGAGIGVGIYFIHRSHTSLTGCVQQTDHGLSIKTKDGHAYELMNPTADVKAGEHLSLRGHKVKATSGPAFRVDRVSRDYGACSPSVPTKRRAKNGREIPQSLTKQRLTLLYKE